MASGEARPIEDDEAGRERLGLAPVPDEGSDGAPPRRDAVALAPLPRRPARRVDPTPPAPPDAAATARALGLCVVEVLTGGREVDSIARWVTEDVHRHLQQRAAVATRARSLGGRARARPRVQVGSVRTCPVADGVVEAAVVVHTRSHARAVALRLELRQGRWRATAVGVL
ncbi:Rv3235 family protein [Curtobacterium sp. NPDC089185]|uniref:Rv3235 family protein n=1 Tax=Curtobacterium sp. NPDC089185 TaxID=3154968 RepID=UPI003449A368